MARSVANLKAPLLAYLGNCAELLNGFIFLGIMYPDKSNPAFTRRSDTESICMQCFLTVRSKSPEYLDIAERNHAANCLQRAQSAAA